MSRILIFDGAFGTMLQRLGRRGEDNERLNLTDPELIQGIHEEYIAAGADIISTNSFGANRLSQEAYGLAPDAARMAQEAAAIARRAAARAPRRILVAGSLGPTGHSLSIASDAENPAMRSVDFETMKEAYKEQAAALVEGGADYFLLETCFDALNAKAAICAFEELGNPLPVLISATVSDRSGRTLTGQTLEAFYTSVKHCPRLEAFGINCALGIEAMTPLVREVASFSGHPLLFYPNAGLPDEMGRYSDSPEFIASEMSKLADEGLLNIAGGCCGTGPEHIAAIAAALKGKQARTVPKKKQLLSASGLEKVTVDRSLNFTNIGERTNVAGSKKFAKLISSDNYPEAIDIARAQVEGGASIIDINTDDPMVDSSEKMRTFLRHIAGEPAVAKAAIMIDSSHWDTILEGLRNAQGKCIVNSISLKDGEEEFLRKALTIRNFGAAMVVMAFDEKGQAETLERKIEVCARSYGLLTRAGIPPEEIIFDCNILTVGTGIAEHSRFGVDFIEAVRWIKTNLPHALTSGGVSNLSFAFRGNNPVREAMHSVFLYHAIKAGLDMAIVNPGMLQVYDTVDPDLRAAIEDVIFDADPQATARLVEIASRISASAQEEKAGAPAEEIPATPEERLTRALVKGSSPTLAEDTLQALQTLGSAIAVVEGPLMAGMEKVGALFAEGKMFLPQVVKSAKVMKDAVEVLRPYMENEEGTSARPKFLIATVQGDVHDIGKNITSIVLQCSGFEVIDLGVMVPCEETLRRAAEVGADIIGVSGLISPSLSRMEELCAEMHRRGLDTPLFVGGAAASAVHTAVRLSPLYANVHYGANASDTAVMAKKCISDPKAFRESETGAQSRLRTLYEIGRGAHVSHCSCCHAGTGGFADGFEPQDLPLRESDAAEFTEMFDWEMFYGICRAGNDPAMREQLRKEALERIANDELKVRICARFLHARRDGDDIVTDEAVFPMLRDSASGFCLADLFPEGGNAPLGLFAVSVSGPETGKDDLTGYALRAALAETASKMIQERLRSGLPEGLRLIAPGIGYSCCPDHSLKRDILAMLPGELGITLTSSCAMIPEESVCGFIMAHRDAAYGEIRTVSAEALKAYGSKRGFSEEEGRLFLAGLMSCYNIG